jgi:hypothetical protein
MLAIGHARSPASLGHAGQCLVGVLLAVGACGGSQDASGEGTDASDHPDADGGRVREAAGPDVSFDAPWRFDAGARLEGGPPFDGFGGGHDAAMCPDPRSIAGPVCDTCIVQNCEAVWCVCRNDPDHVDDAGRSGCLDYVRCAEVCVAMDAGTPTDCLRTICATADYTIGEQHEGQAYLDCRVQYCSRECSQ